MAKTLKGEHGQQVRLFQWAAVQEANYPELRWLFAVPNGGARHVAVASKLKAEGVKAGVWDVFLPVPKGKCPGLWIEMKYGKNKLTPKQREFEEHLERHGYERLVCYDWNDAADKLEEYLG